MIIPFMQLRCMNSRERHSTVYKYLESFQESSSISGGTIRVIIAFSS